MAVSGSKISVFLIWNSLLLCQPGWSSFITLNQSVVAEKETCDEDLVLLCEGDSVIFIKELDSRIGLTLPVVCLGSWCHHIVSEDDLHWLSLKSECTGQSQCTHSISHMSIECIPYRANYEHVVYSCVTGNPEIVRETPFLSCGGPLEMTCEDIPNSEILLDPWQSWLSSGEWEDGICHYDITCRDYTSDLDAEHWQSVEELCNKQRKCVHHASMAQLPCSEMRYTYEQVVYYCVISDNIKSSTTKLTTGATISSSREKETQHPTAGNDDLESSTQKSIASGPTISSIYENTAYYPTAASSSNFPTTTVTAVGVVLVAILAALVIGILLVMKRRGRKKQSKETSHTGDRAMTVTQNDYTMPGNSQISSEYEHVGSSLVTNQRQFNDTYVNITSNGKRGQASHTYPNTNIGLTKHSQTATDWNSHTNQNKNIKNETNLNETTFSDHTDDYLMEDNELYSDDNISGLEQPWDRCSPVKNARCDSTDQYCQDNHYNETEVCKPSRVIMTTIFQASGNTNTEEDGSVMKDNELYQ